MGKESPQLTMDDMLPRHIKNWGLPKNSNWDTVNDHYWTKIAKKKPPPWKGSNNK